MLGRGPGAALQPGAAGGTITTINTGKHQGGKGGLGSGTIVSQRSHQIEFVFRLLLKTTVVVVS